MMRLDAMGTLYVNFETNNNVIKFVSDLWQVGGFHQVVWFPPPIKQTPGCNWNIVESGVKHHKPN